MRTTPEGRAIVNKYHERYIKGITILFSLIGICIHVILFDLALKALYDAFKDKWAINRCESMRLVENKTFSRSRSRARR